MAFSLTAVLATLTLQAFLYVPLTVIALLVAKRASSRARVTAFSHPWMRRVVIVAASCACIGTALALMVVGPMVDKSRKAHADAVVKADLQRAATAQDRYFEEYGEYTRSVYGLDEMGWQASNWDYFDFAGIGFNVNPGMFVQRDGDKPGFCMYATSISGRTFHIDSDFGEGEGNCPPLNDPNESSSETAGAPATDTGTGESESSNSSERTETTDLAFCSTIEPLVNAAIDIEMAARSGDEELFRTARLQMATAAEDVIGEVDRFSPVSDYADAYGTMDYYLGEAADLSTTTEWNEYRRGTGSHITRGLVVRAGETCPVYRAVVKSL